MNVANTHDDIRYIEKTAREGNDTKQLSKTIESLLKNLSLALEQMHREQL